MLSASTPAQRLAELKRPNIRRALLQVVNNGAKEPRAELSPPAPKKPSVDFSEISRILQLAKTTLQEELARVLRLKERVEKLKTFEEAHFRDRQTIDELRADRDLWRKQAVAMSNFLLATEQR
jgi:hypothetical protein